MNRFACNTVTSEELRFTVRIEQFSLYVLRGYFISPEFESESSDTKWSLVVGVNDGADYDNYIEVRLRRNEFSCEEQLVKAKVAIVGFPNLPLLTEVCEKDLFFGVGRKDAQVLTVTKKRLFGFFGMNKLRLLPIDTLTLVCELVIHKYRVQTFDRRRDFENVAGHQGPARMVKYFAHISMERKTFDFVRRIRNFSEHRGCGRCVSPQFQKEHSDCKWSIVVRAYDWGFTDGSFDILLQRSDSNGTGQFVEVELSIVDGNDKTLKFEEKSVYFRGSPDEESSILTIDKKDMLLGCFGFYDVFKHSRLFTDGHFNTEM